MTDENNTLLNQITCASDKLDALGDRIDAIQVDVGSLRKTSERLSAFMEELSKQSSAEKESNDFKNGLPQGKLKQTLRQIIQKNFSSDVNDPWLRKTLLSASQVPPFLSVEQRNQLGLKTRFLSFLNFKGGVGKTTLTSNLAAAFAAANFKVDAKNAQPLRVLVIDLDFQGTLSDRCTNPWEYMKAVDSSTTSPNLLFKPERANFAIDQLTLPFIQSERAKIVPTSDLLDAYDNKVFCYQVFQLYEMRFNYRLWFHNEEFMRKYDLVIFDCPPRKTASVICAMTSSDFVFVPTAPESLDVQSIGRTIQWLVRLRFQLALDLKIGGIVFNRTSAETKLSNNEVDYKTQLESAIKDFFIDSPTEASKEYLKTCDLPSILQSFVPKRTGNNSIIGDACQALPGANKKLKFITNLATEIYQRIYK
ncbi:MAG: ParA family protein [Thermoguttaceae bacterium]|nr:ParA family protein [Thermoguttaceae bacterium]